MSIDFAAFGWHATVFLDWAHSAVFIGVAVSAAVVVKLLVSIGSNGY